MATRIAMWSGPRNISTALLRSWGNRPDTFVCDEPLYAHYLLHTDVQHPGREEVIARHETDWRKVADWLTGPVPEARAVFYQKHMAHHLLGGIDRGWLERLTHCFLIREPKEMLTSLIQKYPQATLEDTGLPQQVELAGFVQERSGRPPAILDARDVLEDPRRMLGLLCERVGVPFLEQMLAWPAGPRDTDGVWARYWYENVEQSTGFQAYKPKDRAVPERYADVLRACEAHYEKLYRLRLS